LTPVPGPAEAQATVALSRYPFVRTTDVLDPRSPCGGADGVKARLFRILGSAGTLALLAFVLEASKKVPH